MLLLAPLILDVKKDIVLIQLRLCMGQTGMWKSGLNQTIHPFAFGISIIIVQISILW